MSFKTYIIERWDKMSFRDKSMNMMASLKAVSLIKEGTNCSIEELIEDTEKVLEHFYEFDWNQKPDVKKVIPKDSDSKDSPF